MFQHSARCLNIPRQIDFSCRKIIFATAKSVFGIPEIFLSQNVGTFHTKSISSVEKSFFRQQNPFWNSKIFFVIEC